MKLKMLKLSVSYFLVAVANLSTNPAMCTANYKASTSVDSGLTQATKIKQTRYIIVVALKEEVKGVNIELYAPIIYTGVGKINATIKLHEAILRYKPELVINFGTVGAVGNQKGLFHINTFIQTDMDARGAGLVRGVTPASNKKLPDTVGVVLGTSDSFITDAKKQLEGLTVKIDLVDMEGFALREVCEYFGIEFQSYKYVSDSANEEASGDWQKNANKGAQSYLKVLKENYGLSLITD